MKQAIKQRHGFHGPICGFAGCKYPRAECPTHAGRVMYGFTGRPPMFSARSGVLEGKVCPHGYHVCACQAPKAATSESKVGAPAQEPVADVPEGWTLGARPGLSQRFVHATGAVIYTSDYSPGKWVWFSVDDIRRDAVKTSNSYVATRAEAMAVALGFEIQQLPSGRYAWLQNVGGNKVNGPHETAELAALAALAFDAGQRRAPTCTKACRCIACETRREEDAAEDRVKAAKPAEVVFAVGDLVRCVKRGMSFVSDGHVYVVGTRTSLTTLWLRGVEESGYSHEYFVRVAPDELPPGWYYSKDVDGWYYSKTWPSTDYSCPAVAKLDKYHAYKSQIGYRSPAGTLDTLHAAMAAARGLERVDQLWSAA